MQGKISGKNEEKGFGFITPDGMEDAKGNNVFFHTSAVEGTSFEELAIGTMVTYETEASDKGPRAVHVQKV